MDDRASETFLLPMQSTTMGDMIKMFLSCQRCGQVSMKPKQLNCTHTVCTRCALKKRIKNPEAGAWMLDCAICGKMNIWRDGGTQLSGLADNQIMQQVMKQVTGKGALIGETSSKNPGSQSQDFASMYGDKNMTVNIVSAVKEKIEIQEALSYAEKKMMKCQQQTRYIKSYEKKINASKAAIAKKITQTAEILIASVIQEQGRLLGELDALFEDDMKPVEEARGRIEKQTSCLELLTQCCEVATQMLQKGRTPLDMDQFKKMVQKGVKSSRESSLPSEIKRRYKSKVQFICNEENFSSLVRNFGGVGLQIKGEEGQKKARDEEIEKEQQLWNDLMNKAKEMEIQQEEEIEQPIYDLPPDTVEADAIEDSRNCTETIYDEIPAEYYNMDYNLPERPYSATPQDFEYGVAALPSTEMTPPPPRPPKSYELSQYKEKPSEEDVAARLIAQQRRRAINGLESDSRESTDSFSSDPENEEEACSPPPALPPRDNAATRNSNIKLSSSKVPFSPELLRNKGSLQPSSDTDNSSGHQYTPSKEKKVQIKRSNSVRSTVSHSSKSSHRSKLLFSIGRARKTGSKEPQMFAVSPEITSDSEGNIWICDTGNHKVQAHEGTCGNLIASFKTVLNGVTLKPKGIAMLDEDTKIATTCGKYVVVWDKQGKLSRKYGPRSNLGKMFGVAEGVKGNLILGDVENTQIAVESSQVKITAIGTANGTGRSNWPGRLAVNQYGQILTADYTEHCVKIFDYSGALVTKFGSFGAELGQMRYPCAVAVDSKNRIYVADQCNSRITVYSPDGKSCLGHAVTKEDGLNFPRSLTVLENGNIAVSDDTKMVKVYSGYD